MDIEALRQCLEITPSESFALEKCADTNPLLFLLLLRSLERGDTALFCDLSPERLLELISGDQEAFPFVQKNFHKCFLNEGFHAFPRWAHMEEYIAQEVTKRLFSHRRISPILVGERINDQQKVAIEEALASTLFFLTGGPGTGKTHTAGIYLKQKILLKNTPLKVLLLAPTGKAMKTLEKSIYRALKDDKASIEAMTIHAFLMRRREERPFIADSVIIDEASMIDTKLMYDLLLSIDRTTPILFIGDADQLPPIEPGQPFCDIVHVIEEKKLPFVSRLTICERTDSRAIVSFARSVLMGEQVDLQRFGKEIQFLETDSSKGWQRAEQQWLKEIFNPWTSSNLSLSSAQCLIQERVLLTAEKKGGLGSRLLTSRAEQILSLKNASFCPILSTKNSYDLGVMNGEAGVLDTSLFPEVVYFHERSLPLVLLERWEKAYALTVHKSQGSEFQEVHILVPSSKTFSRKLLYTAITRARRKVVLYGTEASLQQAIGCQEERMTSLPFFLKKALSESSLFE
jgi:exodeoxyribonuclease V alpha subunit